MGKARIPRVVDDGVLEVEVAFAPGEGSRVIYGYSLGRPTVIALAGDAEVPAYDPDTQLFSVNVSDDGDGSVVIRMSAEILPGQWQFEARLGHF